MTQYLALNPAVPGASPAAKTAYVAAAIATTLFLLNLILSFYLPEPKPEEHE